MIVVIILLYCLLGFSIACGYNALYCVPLPYEMSDEDKHRMFIIMLFWPIYLLIVFIKEGISCTKWLITKIKK